MAAAGTDCPLKSARPRGAIPSAVGIRENIHQILDNKGLSRNHVQVNILSSENGIDTVDDRRAKTFANNQQGFL